MWKITGNVRKTYKIGPLTTPLSSSLGGETIATFAELEAEDLIPRSLLGTTNVEAATSSVASAAYSRTGEVRLEVMANKWLSLAASSVCELMTTK